MGTYVFGNRQAALWKFAKRLKDYVGQFVGLPAGCPDGRMRLELTRVEFWYQESVQTTGVDVDVGQDSLGIAFHCLD